MSDAALNHKYLGRNSVEDLWKKGIILLQICQEVLCVICVGESGRLDEFKREMWLLLVAAGSGYLARCWQKTLKPKPQLTNYTHVDPQPREERASSSTTQLLEDSSPNAQRRNSPALVANESVPRQSKRNFSPKALSKKLFLDVGKTLKKEKEGNFIADDSRLITAGADKSGDASIVHSKRSAWSSFRTKTRGGASENSEESVSPGCLGRTGDAFRKTRDRRRSSDCGSSSSRSLRVFLGDGGDGSLGSSRREASSVGSSRRDADVSSLEDRSRSGLLVAEISEAEGSGDYVDVLSKDVLLQAAGNEVEPSSYGKKEAQRSPNRVDKDDVSPVVSDIPPTVAEVVSRIEKGTQSLKAETVSAVLSLRAANQAQASLIDREKVRNLQLESLEQNIVEDAVVLPGGKSKRRVDVGKGDGDGNALSSLLTGKRIKDSSKPLARESSEITLTSITCKRMKDVVKSEDSGNSEDAFLSDPFGALDLSQVFLGFDDTFLGSPKEERSPFRNSKRYRYTGKLNRGTIRRIRESPKAVSALESCLRAQMPFREEGTRVARSLNFSSLVTQAAVRSPDRVGQAIFLKDSPFSPKSLGNKDGFGGSEDQSCQTEGALGLPLLKTSPSKSSMQRKDDRFYRRGQQLVESNSNYPRRVVLEERGRVVSSQSKINDVLWRATTLPVAPKKRKVSQACSPSTTPDITKVKGYELEALVIPPMEGLLFSFGVGIGVMSLINEPDGEVERLSEQLQKSQEKIESLNKLLRQAEEFGSPWSGQQLKQVVDAASSFLEGGAVVANGKNEPTANLLALVPTVDETRPEDFDIYRREAPETPQQIEHMAELEAELEAELDALTSGISTSIIEDTSGAPDFEELDPEGVAGVADRDLGVEGLPASLDWDDDNDDFITEESMKRGEGVPPRELARLLRKVQNSWQEQQISELEADLQETVEKLRVVEKELQLLKDQMLCLTPLSTDLEIKNPNAEIAVTPKDFVSSGDRLQTAEIKQPNQSDFNDQRCLLEKLDDFFERGAIQDEIENPLKSNDELSRTAPVTQLSQPMASVQGSMSGVMLSEESMESEAQADNDAVCDEFLNSVFGLSEGVQIGEETLTAVSLVPAVEMLSSPRQGLGTEESKFLTIQYDLKDGNPALTPTGEDLDQVVGELLKRDSSSVKNAINAFLLWEAETDGVPSKEDMVEHILDEQSYSRRTAGKNPTPQKTSLSSPTLPKTSIISTRLEQLALSAFTSEKMPLVDKASGTSKRQAANSDDKSLKRVDKSVGIAQQATSKSEGRSVTLVGLKKDQSPQVPKRDAAKSEVPVRDSLRDSYFSEIPVFGGVGKEFQALLDARRELRYSSTKVQLSLAGPPQERDSTLYKHREDAIRAGTNSPTGKVPGRSLYLNSRAKNSRMANENRLYQNPTSDWLAEVGSPPDS